MPLTIRDCTVTDIPAITLIYAHAVRFGTASFELEPPDEAEMLRRQRALLDGGFPYIVAEGDGAVLGYAYAGPYRTRPAYRHTVENSIYIAPAVQRQGIGRRLLDALIVRATEAGFRQMIAVIGDSTLQGPSIGLHAAAGFRMVGTLDAVGYKHGRWLDSVYMQRTLGAGAEAGP
jgi:phosphinothricin acetyltransferase